MNPTARASDSHQLHKAKNGRAGSLVTKVHSSQLCKAKLHSLQLNRGSKWPKTINEPKMQGTVQHQDI